MNEDATMGKMLSCDKVMRQLWDYLDEELTPERMSAIAAHLSGCNRCFPQYDFERAFLRAVRSVREENPPPAQQRERVMAALRANGLP